MKSTWYIMQLRKIISNSLLFFYFWYSEMTYMAFSILFQVLDSGNISTFLLTLHKQLNLLWKIKAVIWTRFYYGYFCYSIINHNVFSFDDINIKHVINFILLYHLVLHHPFDHPSSSQRITFLVQKCVWHLRLQIQI